MFELSLAVRNNCLKAVIITILFIVSAIFPAASSYANNLDISNVTVSDPDSSQETIKITFDISWDNSWKNAFNHDAVWLFLKYSTDEGASWGHCTLYGAGLNPEGFSQGDGANIDIDVAADSKGCILRRTYVGAGTLDVTDVELLWDWGQDGLDASSEAQVKVIGIEMVYIPEGSFYIGDGNGADESPKAFHLAAGNSSVQITSALTSDIRVDSGSDDVQLTTAGIGIDGDDGIDVDDNGTIDNASFPVGYNAFYLMKYEITEEQWVEFFNMLSNSQTSNRDITGASGKNTDAVLSRNTVNWSGIGDASALRPDRACGYLSWPDICAYADWAALRPMTELEYEKSARGQNASAYGEFAWGTDDITAAVTIAGTEDGTETIGTTDANACFGAVTFTGGDGGSGPLRAGIFATETSSRTQSGAGYYGNMELSGNLKEAVVSVGHASGRSFLGTHGNGELTVNGFADNSDWPGYVSGQGVTSASGAGYRGGSWLSATEAAIAVSDRSYAASEDDSRSGEFGGRLVRTSF